MASNAARRISPVLGAAEAYLELSTKGKGRHASPVIRVLLADGRTTEFAERAVVIPESGPDEASQRVYALLINGNGEVFVQPDGEPALIAVPAMTLRVGEDGNKILSLDEIAELSGTSLATVRRRIEDGTLPKPLQISKRRVGLSLSAVKKWLSE